MLQDRLFREIAVVLAVKLMALTLIWWVFVRDQRVEVDASRLERAFIGSPDVHPESTPP